MRPVFHIVFLAFYSATSIAQSDTGLVHITCNTNFDPDELLKDADGDGVIDMNDKDPTTTAFTPVDIDGIALDSDHDGCSDDVDPEPKSDLLKEMDGCENVNAAPDFIGPFRYDIIHIGENVRKRNPQVWYLPNIYFKPGSDTILTTSYIALKQILEVESKFGANLILYCRLEKPGLNENVKQLEVNRILAVINYLLNNGVNPALISWEPTEFQVLILNDNIDYEDGIYKKVEVIGIK